ncbi:Hypothetical predicted protein [Paramuricea clavata]|uniref:Uncharacterized protein n=1 Tax=Paramuricea clavata TaxID=317549 RepID=A0A6S7GZA4_PARCT|nr:Hypothetical predicted protein [Paramuricea clavata]
MKCSIVLLVLVLSIMTAFLVNESDAGLLPWRPKIRTIRVVIMSPTTNNPTTGRGRRIRKIKENIKKRHNSGLRVPAMHAGAK